MENEIKVGSAVLLKSEGSFSQPMTAVAVEANSVTCTWRDKSGKLRKETFPMEALQLVSQAKGPAMA